MGSLKLIKGKKITVQKNKEKKDKNLSRNCILFCTEAIIKKSVSMNHFPSPASEILLLSLFFPNKCEKSY